MAESNRTPSARPQSAPLPQRMPIRHSAQEADNLRDKKQAMAAQTLLKLVAARNDKGLQSVLQSAKRLRLVYSADDEALE